MIRAGQTHTHCGDVDGTTVGRRLKTPLRLNPTIRTINQDWDVKKMCASMLRMRMRLRMRMNIGDDIRTINQDWDVKKM